jgi:hypothetical protein
MPDLNPSDAAAATDQVVRHRFAPLVAWAIGLAVLALAVLLTVAMASAEGGAPGMTWFDWAAMAFFWAMGGIGAWTLTRAAMTWLTLGADGSVRLATRTLFGGRERRLEPGEVSRVELRRNPFGPIMGWQVILHWRAGGRLVVSERIDAAAQAALAEDIARRLGLEGAG